MEREYLWGEGMSVDEAYILGVYNESLSYLSLLEYGVATAASEYPKNEEKWKQLKKENSVRQASENARKRRQLISEKTRCLQKLLPWNTKMDTATMLGEAANYVKFLQAQICVLNSMPLHAPTSASSFSNEAGMDSSNRGELLGVMLNSPRIQTVLSRNGWCLYTLEQMAALLDNPLHVLPEYHLHGMLSNYY